MRLIDADKYMNHLRANINTTSDIIAEQIKKDKPIGTVADGGQIGYLNALQWARASLECDCYTVKAIPLDKVKQTREDIKDTFYVDSLIFGELMDFKEGKISADDVIEEFNKVARKEVLEILDVLIEGGEEE